MPSYGVSIRDTASGFTRRFQRSLEGRKFNPAIGEAGKRVLVDHFAQKQADPSSHKTADRLGAKPAGIYAQFARGTSWEAEGDTVTLSVNHPAVRQRLEGGTIRPVNAKALTIPANSYAYGKRAREVGVRLVFAYALDPGRGMRPALIAAEAVMKPTGKARKDGTRRQRQVRPSGVYFWIVRKVTQKPDPTVLPEEDKLLDGVADGLKGWLDEQIAKGD